MVTLLQARPAPADLKMTVKMETCSERERERECQVTASTIGNAE